MEKSLLTILFFFCFSSLALGCSCADIIYTINDKYILSDFVGTIKITSTEEIPNSTAERVYIANIKPLAVFKGEAPLSLRVSGTKSGMNWGASCELSVNAGEEWLVAISKNNLNYFPLNYCSFAGRLKSSDGKNTSRGGHWQAIKHFQFLNQKVPNLHRDYMLRESSGKISKYLDQFDGQSFDRESAHYIITFDENLSIKTVEVLKGFHSEFDKNFISFLKQQTRWEKENPQYETTPVTDGTKHIVGIFYYEEEKKFLSRF
ncbi:hypothetical protein [Rhodohalobacter sp.]|uniref:hypothetical protein n=1 Tax=Rhodohalobacter sp. TaxID=1974210 RepID=UPI002ACE8A68|nr:hypothetical protein [Rhodohalobacter sp.]MDZ7755993.1 hypothetical protein [Rhodohalobacter sp.]